MAAGRPLRFLALLLCGWAAARGVAIYRDGAVAAGPLADPLRRIAAALAPAAEAATLDRTVRRSPPAGSTGAPASAGPAAVNRRAVLRSGLPATAILPAVRAAAATVASAPAVAQTWPAVLPPATRRIRSRWSGSAWMIARGGVQAAAVGSQLGGSQAGLRITYAVDRTHRVALAARVSSPLAGPGKEAALGLDWQPTRLPVHLLAEHRISLDGGRGGPTLGIVGGFGPADVAPGVRLEGYGQAGVIARNGGEGFADGAIRASRPLVRTGRLALDVGAGLWGGAQRGASRLDVGPSLGLTVPAGRHTLRLTADWRQRIAGESRPGSGLAVSLGTDF